MLGFLDEHFSTGDHRQPLSYNTRGSMEEMSWNIWQNIW